MSSLADSANEVRNHETTLVIAAHPDDEVLGCGGTLARFAREGRAVHVLLLADGESSRFRSSEGAAVPSALAARSAAATLASEILGCTSVEVLALPDNRMDTLDLLDVVRHIESAVERHRPSCVLTHHSSDVNVDHRIVHDAVIAACRPQPSHPVRELLFFEVPSSTEWRPPGSGLQFNPNWFVDISSTLEKKLEALRAYQAELRVFPHARSLQGVNALARWRGASVGVEAAEAFVLGRKTIV
jgi:LmbE family N-acetylglucosaminyl deacetylase